MKTKIYLFIILFLTCFSLSLSFCPTEIVAEEVNGYVDIEIGSDGKVKVKNDKFKTQDAAFEHIIDKYKNIITFISGLGAITMVGIFIKHFIELGASASNPAKRSQLLIGLLWSGLAAAGLGSIALIVGVFYGLLK